MPLRNNKVYCVNHQDTLLVQNVGFNALVTVDRTEFGTTFDPKSGIPVIAFSCPICGYIEMYAAQKNEAWNDAANWKPSYESREYEVIEAIQAENSPFHPEKVIKNANFPFKNKVIEVDVVVFSKIAAFIIEIKLSTSLTTLERAAARVRDIKNVLTHNIPDFPELLSNTYVPLVITVDDPKIPNYIRGVPILKYNSNKKSFVNVDAFPELLIHKDIYSNFYSNKNE